MNPTSRHGLWVGAALALALVSLGFWQMLVVALGMAVGALVGRWLDGRLDVRGIIEAVRGRAT